MFEGSQLVRTIRILQKKDCPKGDGKHQLKKTMETIRGRKK